MDVNVLPYFYFTLRARTNKIQTKQNRGLCRPLFHSGKYPRPPTPPSPEVDIVLQPGIANKSFCLNYRDHRGCT